jgi:electron transfer flavoprotein alpha subunit
MANLILCEHDGVALSPTNARLVGAARQLGGPIDLLVAGTDCAAIADEAARLDGVARILVADDPRLAGQGAEPVAALLAAHAGDYRVLLAAASSAGKNIMPRAAALLGVAQISEVTKVLDETLFEHPIYAGNAIETVRATDARLVLTVRGAAFDPCGTQAAPAAIVAVALPEFGRAAELVARSQPARDRPELGTARIVVSGGRAFGSKASFEELLVPLADRLGAAIGASRAAVDAGYAPNDWQVGQTGKIVAPDIYIAIGISGAIQHLAGMKDAGLVVAINKDADAPIFEMADLGLVGDLFEIVPQLTAALGKSS